MKYIVRYIELPSQHAGTGILRTAPHPAFPRPCVKFTFKRSYCQPAPGSGSFESVLYTYCIVGGACCNSPISLWLIWQAGKTSLLFDIIMWTEACCHRYNKAGVGKGGNVWGPPVIDRVLGATLCTMSTVFSITSPLYRPMSLANPTTSSNVST
jgi:hypothetical protein